jgi:hypothetical protein
VLSRVLGGGAAALAKESELLAVAGPVAGGLLTGEDLQAVRPAHVDCDVYEDDGWTVARAPWNHEDAESASVRVLVAADGRGTVAVACYEAPQRGLSIEALGLIAPSHADPVRRGVRRTSPGEPLPAPCPIAIARAVGLVLALAARDEAVLTIALRACWATKPLPEGSIGAIFSAKKARALPGRP